MDTERQIQLEALKFVSNSLKMKDFSINPMSEDELKVYFDTLAGCLIGMSTVIRDVDKQLHEVIMETVDQLSLR